MSDIVIKPSTGDAKKHLRKFIMLPTIQSTGTWWAVRALQAHPEVGAIMHPQNLIHFNNDWTLREGWTGNPHDEAFAEDGKTTLLYSHYGGTPANYTRWKPSNDYEWLMQVVPALAPLRDPLLCMIRAYHRESSLYPHNYLIDGWLFVARREGTMGINYWRMDPFDIGGFLGAVKAVGLSCPDNWIAELDWKKKINDTPGECDLRTYYANGDLRAIKKVIPIPVRHLQDNEVILRPFLEKVGFKDLMWWSK